MFKVHIYFCVNAGVLKVVLLVICDFFKLFIFYNDTVLLYWHNAKWSDVIDTVNCVNFHVNLPNWFVAILTLCFCTKTKLKINKLQLKSRKGCTNY